jgi:hypothetical protein
MSEDKVTISREIAEIEFKKFEDYYDIELDEDEEPSPFKKKLVKALQKGKLVFDDSDGFQVTQTTRTGTVIKYSEITARHKLQMTKLGGDDSIERLYALLGSMSGLGADAIKQLKGPDLPIAEGLAALFLDL